MAVFSECVSKAGISMAILRLPSQICLRLGPYAYRGSILSNSSWTNDGICIVLQRARRKEGTKKSGQEESSWIEQSHEFIETLSTIPRNESMSNKIDEHGIGTNESVRERRSTRQSIPTKAAMLQCAVRTCDSTAETLAENGQTLKFFSLPDSEADNGRLRSQWTKAVRGICSIILPNHQKVCARHFVDGFPSKAFPIPTLHLGYEKTQVTPARKKPLSNGSLDHEKADVTVTPTIIKPKDDEPLPTANNKESLVAAENRTPMQTPSRVLKKEVKGGKIVANDNEKPDAQTTTPNYLIERPRRKRAFPAAFVDYISPRHIQPLTRKMPIEEDFFLDARLLQVDKEKAGPSNASKSDGFSSSESLDKHQSRSDSATVTNDMDAEQKPPILSKPENNRRDESKRSVHTHNCAERVKEAKKRLDVIQANIARLQEFFANTSELWDNNACEHSHGAMEADGRQPSDETESSDGREGIGEEDESGEPFEHDFKDALENFQNENRKAHR